MIKKLLPIVSYTLAFKENYQDYDYQKVVDDYQILFNEIELDEEILFIIVCWIDETILLSEWNEKLKWVSNSFQKKYFNTNNGGELFFEKMEKSDNKIIYAYFLKLGFKGKYYDDENKIDELISKYFPKQDIKILFPSGYSKNPNKNRKFISFIYNFKSVIFLVIVLAIIFGVIYLNLEIDFSSKVNK